MSHKPCIKCDREKIRQAEQAVIEAAKAVDIFINAEGAGHMQPYKKLGIALDNLKEAIDEAQ